MAFKREDSPRELELTSLIDVVFLLLIFFLVSFAFSIAGDASQSTAATEIPLPKSSMTRLSLKGDKLANLMIQIMPDTTGSRIAYILWPSYQEEVEMTEDIAFQKSLNDSTFCSFPVNFLSLSNEDFSTSKACSLIAISIKQFVEKEKVFKQNGRPVVEVRAEKNTEFKIMNFILEQCGLYEDRIPQVIFRTAS